MKPAPYSFWCSGCKKDHPGECPPKAARGLPPIGSKWGFEMQRNGGWVLAVRGPYVVTGYNKASDGAVTSIRYRYGSSEEVSCSTHMWDRERPAGAGRFVPYVEDPA